MDYYRVGRVRQRSEMELLYYEIQGLVSARPEDCQNQNKINIRLEAFLVHVRNLLDFLAGKEVKPTDITYQRFKKSDGGSFRPCEFNVPDHKKLKRAIDKHLSHLTEERAMTKYHWNVEAVRNEVTGQLRAFLAQLSDQHFGENATKANILKLLG